MLTVEEKRIGFRLLDRIMKEKDGAVRILVIQAHYDHYRSTSHLWDGSHKQH